AAGGVLAVGDAVPGDGAEEDVLRAAGAALRGQAVERDVRRVVGDDRRPAVVAVEPDRARGPADPAGLVDVPAVGRPGADAVGVVVVRVVERYAGAHGAVAARYRQIDVVECLVADPVRRVVAEDGRAVRALARALYVVEVDVADRADARAVAAPLAGTDLLH